MKKLFFLTITLTVLLTFAGKADGSISPVILDGVNSLTYDFKNFTFPQFHIQLPATFIEDTNSITTPAINDSTIIISGLCNIGSETGDQLFSRLAGESGQNREHNTQGGLWLRIPKTKLQLSGSYRHRGVYSDNIEQHTAEYAINRKTGLQFTNIGDYGIGEYTTGQWRYPSGTSQFNGTLIKSGEWKLIPGLYIPVYKNGYTYCQAAQFPLLSGKFNFAGTYSQQKYQLDHECSTKETHYSLESSYGHAILTDDELLLQFSLSSDQLSRYQGALSYTKYLFQKKVKLYLNAALWENLQPETDVAFTYALSQQASVHLNYHYDFNPGEQTITTLGPHDTITISRSTAHTNNISCEMSFEKETWIPISLNIWTQYQSCPYYLQIDTSDNSIGARFKASEHYLLYGGGTFAADIPFTKIFTASIWTRGNILFSGKPSEYLPFECGCTFQLSSLSDIPLKAKASIMWRDSYQWNARIGNSDTTMSTSSILYGNLNFIVPIVSPILTSHITPTLYINAESIPLYPTKRPSYHPFGNPAGPLISVKLQADVRK